MIASPLETLRQVDVDKPRLDDGIAVAQVDFENPLHPSQRDHHAAAHGKAPAGEARSRSPRNERDVELIARFDDRHDLFTRCRQQDDVRGVLLDDVPVAFVDQQIVGIA